MSDDEIRSKLNIIKTVMKGGAEGLAFSWLILLDPTKGAENRVTKQLLRTYLQRGNQGLMVWELRDAIANRQKQVQPPSNYEANISRGGDMSQGKGKGKGKGKGGHQHKGKGKESPDQSPYGYPTHN